MKRLLLTVGLLALLFAVASSLPSANAAPPAQTQVATQAAPQNDCSKAPAPQLKTGAPAQVMKTIKDDVPGAMLKAGATHDGPVLRYLPVGTVVDVVDGPTCVIDTNWWKVKIADLSGWLIETSGQDYLLQPYTSTDPAPTPAPSTVANLLTCIEPNTPPTPQAPAGAKGTFMRLVYGSTEGGLLLSDNGDPSHVVALFNPPPISVDISPDGSAALVVTYNGLYWVDLSNGALALIADSTSFSLGEADSVRRVWWLPDGKRAALELVNIDQGLAYYGLWNIPIDGSRTVFQVDTGAQAMDGLFKSPNGTGAIVVSANDIELYPKSLEDETPALLEFVPAQAETDVIMPPSLVWTRNGAGFYTYIPVSAEAPSTDKVGGHIWYVPLKGNAQSVSTPKLEAKDVVIPSPGGDAYLIGSGEKWVIRNMKTGAVVQALPPVGSLLDWTPDGKGIAFTTKTGSAAYLGIDGITKSAYVPDADNLYAIKWLPNDTMFYIVKGSDGKLTFNSLKIGESPLFRGVLPDVGAFSVALFANAPGTAQIPQQCKPAQ